MKKVAIFLITLILFTNITIPTYAQVVSDAPSPTIDQSTPSPTDVPTDIPSPTDVPSDSPTPTDIVPSPTDIPSGIPTDTSSDTPMPTDGATGQPAPTGSSSNTSSGTTSTPTGDPKVTTGDATGTADVTNAVNTTSINSQVVRQTINLFVDYKGDIDLSSPAQMINDLVDNHPNDPVINVALTGVDNYAYINNTVDVSADTGDNTINATGSATTLNTGDATALASVLNEANLVIINSVIHIITVNIFGNIDGNIILPNANPTDSQSAQMSVFANNNALITNTASSSANTGNNTINASGSASLTTGNAESLVNILNVANTGVVDADLMGIYINVLGTWDGSFLGWGDLAPEEGSATLSESNLVDGAGNPTTCPSCMAMINNAAIINNTVVSSANTGNNTVNGGDTTAKTGNAYSAINIINFINSYFINSWGFFGIFNIFGNWHGDIGQASNFPTPTPTETQVSSSDITVDNSSDNKEDGGALELTESTNAGKYILPGDTLTLFLKGKNTGTGKVYGATLSLHLIHNGVDMGDPSFTIGDLDTGHSFSMTTGIVIPKSFEGGTYTVHAVLTGTTGNDNTVVTATADSDFLVYANNLVQPAFATGSSGHLPKDILKGGVLGVEDHKDTTKAGLQLVYLLLASSGLYLLLRFRGTIYGVWKNKRRLIP